MIAYRYLNVTHRTCCGKFIGLRIGVVFDMRSRPGRLALVVSLLPLGLAACNDGGGNGNGNGMPGGHRSQNTATQQSTNWSGYVREGSGLNRVSGSWIVPKVTCGGK